MEALYKKIHYPETLRGIVKMSIIGAIFLEISGEFNFT